MIRGLIFFSFIFLFQQTVLAKSIYVNGQGRESSYCNANSGSFCLDRVKRNAEMEAQRDARFKCEINENGRALTFTASVRTYCSPNYLPPRHDGTFVNCNSDCRMECELKQ